MKIGLWILFWFLFSLS